MVLRSFYVQLILINLVSSKFDQKLFQPQLAWTSPYKTHPNKEKIKFSRAKEY